MDWKSLIDLVGPTVGALSQAPGGGRTGFLRGWQDAEQRHKAEALAAQQRQTQRGDAGARYALDVADHLNQFTDPIEFEHYREFASQLGTKAGLDVSALGSLAFPESKRDARKLKELTDQLDALEKGGYNLDELATQAGAHVELKDGTQVPISSALSLTRKRPMANGQVIPKPSKADTAPPTDYGRFLAKYAKEKGKTVDQLTSAEELQAKKDFNTIDDRPVAPPRVDPASPAAQLGDLVALWKESNPGKEPPANVMTQLRKQANLVNDQPKAPKEPKTLSPNEALRETRQLRNDYVKETSAAKTAATQLALMKSSLAAVEGGSSPAGSQGVLVTFQKILDPNSVVRESEYARSGSGLSLLSRLQGTYDKLVQGGAGVPVAELRKFVTLAEQFASNQAAQARRSKVQLDAIADEYGLKKDLITRDYEDPTPAVTAPPKTGAGLTYQDYLRSKKGGG